MTKERDETGSEPEQPEQQGMATRAIHSGRELHDATPLVPPIYQSTTFALSSAAEGAAMAVATRPTDFYTRWGNPTIRAAENVAASLEGVEAALAVSSGMAALTLVVFSHLDAGDHLVIGESIYSGVQEIATSVLPRYGIEATRVDSRDVHAIEAALRADTRLILVESPTNPTLDLCDLRRLADLGKRRGIATAVDNTFATPVLQRPQELGIDTVVHSATKYLGGHSDVTGGLVCSSKENIERAWKLLKLFGSCLSPFEAWLLQRGMKTLTLRVERQSRTALELARFLETHPRVERVHYPGLESHPQHALARLQMQGFGGMLAFEVDGGYDAGKAVAESLQVIQLAVSLGGVESIIQHPASMSHGMLAEDARRAARITPGLLRLSVGLEAVEDLQRDLERALLAVVNRS